MSALLEGEIEITFRGEKKALRAGETADIPANAPHFFRNVSRAPACMLCMCTPPGQEELFMAVGDPVESRTAPPPELSAEEIEDRRKKAETLAPTYRTELLSR